MALRRLHKSAHDYPGSGRLKLLSKLSSLILICLFGGLLLTIAIIIFFATQIPSPEELANRNIASATKIYDRNGELLYDIFKDQNRTPVKFADIPDTVKKATIAIEDKDFYNHQGFSTTGITRAFFNLITSRHIEGGGSTLTQQLVKNALLSDEQTFTRKLKELILAVQVERSYSKDQILEMYLNEIPYGGTAYGIEAAANLYFGKHANELNLAESAMLAGLPQSPSVYSPYSGNLEMAKSRQGEVLRRMVEDKYISPQQAEAAKNTELTYRTSKNEVGFKAPHFVLYVKQKLIEQFGKDMVEQGGLRVTTSLDFKLQEDAQKIVLDEITKLKNYKVDNGAAVVMDPKTGQILAMVGSKDYFAKDFQGNYNAALAYRQPGSATKPITFAAGMQKGYTAATPIMDVKTVFPGGIGQPDYIPENYDGKFHGPVQVRYALGNSYNIPSVKMLAMVGLKNVMDLGYRMGLTTWEPTEQNLSNVGLSLTLGGREVRLLDLTSAYAVFANGGKKRDPISILKVTDTKGKTLYEYRQTDGQKVLDEGIAFIISDILADNGARTAAFGPSSILNVPGKTVSVKTGTTDYKKDNWTVGYTPSVVVGVWVGNNDNTAMNPSIASGVTGASPIWQKIIIAALKDKQNERPNKPDNVNHIDVDGLMGGQPKEGTPTRKEYFVKGTEPTSHAEAYQRQKVCTSNIHRIANDGEEAEDRDVIILKEDDPTGANKWQEGIDHWVLNSADTRFVGWGRGCSNIPTFTASSSSGVISIVNIANGANVPKVFDVLASVNSPNGVKKVTWLVDGAEKSTIKSEPWAVHVEFPEGDQGSHTISATLEDNDGKTYSTAVGVTVNF